VTTGPLLEFAGIAATGGRAALVTVIEGEAMGRLGHVTRNGNGPAQVTDRDGELVAVSCIDDDRPPVARQSPGEGKPETA